VGVTEHAPRTESIAEARAASRRRWITFGEVLTVIAVAISGLGLWNTWSQRRADEVQKAAEADRAAVHSATLVFTATNVGKRELVLKPASSEQTVQDQHIAFPTPLGVAPEDTTGQPRIDAAWFERALIKARAAAHVPDNNLGDAQLPVAITTRFLVDGDPHEDVALYNVGYSIAPGWFGSHSVTLRGIALIARAKADTVQARLDARWSSAFAHSARTGAAAKPD